MPGVRSRVAARSDEFAGFLRVLAASVVASGAALLVLRSGRYRFRNRPRQKRDEPAGS